MPVLSCIVYPVSCIANYLTVRTIMKKAYFLIITILTASLLSACAEKGPVLLSINYQAPEGKETAVSKKVVAVSPLKDRRGKSASIIGLRTIHDLQNDLVVQDTVSKMVTESVQKAFEARGITVKDAGEWDLTDAGIKKNNTANLLIGGEITALWLESKALMLSTNVKSTVKIKIVVGDMDEKKVIRTINVASTLDEDILYSNEKLEQELSDALSSAVNQIFNDDELKKRLQ